MADIAAQREARRRKITQNAEARLNRLLGITNDDGETSAKGVVSQSKHEDSVESEIHTSAYNLRQRPQKEASPIGPPSNRSQRQTPPNNSTNCNFNTEDQIDFSQNADVRSKNISISKKDIPVDEKHQEHVSTLEPMEETNNPSPAPEIFVIGLIKSLNVHSLELFKICSFATVAFLSRFFLKFGIGLFFVQTIFLPFIAVEVVLMYIIYKYLHHLPLLQSKGTLVSAALMLCGIRQDLIDSYHNIMSYVASVTNDFCLFVFSFILWNLVLT